MIRLALRTLRYRTSGFIATFVAVALGAAIVMACGGLMETGIRSNVDAERLAGAPIVVTGNQSYKWPGADEATPLPEPVRIPAGLAAKIHQVPGVDRVVPVVSFPATVVRDGRPVTEPSQGHGWASATLAPYKLTAGKAPARDGQVVLDAGTAGAAGARVGSRVELAVRGVTQTFTVSGIATGPATAGLFSDAEASRLTGRPGTVNSFGVIPAAGVNLGDLQDAVSTAVGDKADVLAGADRGMAEHPDATDKESLIALAGSFGGIATMTMMFVIAATLALSAQHRQRELALMRTVGSTPGQVRRMVLGEAVVVAVPAVLVGCLPGLFLGRMLFEQLAEHGVASPHVEYRQGWLPLLVGAGAALLAAIGAAVIAGRKAGRTRPVEALREAGLQRRWFGWVRFVAGMLFLAGGLALVIITKAVMSGPLAGATAGPSVLCWAIGVALLGPPVTAAVLSVLRWPVQAFGGVSGRLAVLNVTARSVAMSAAVMPVMLATGIATANLYMQTTQVDAAEKAFTADLRADAVLVSTTGGLAPDLLDRVRDTPGVASASAYASGIGVIDSPRKGYQDSSGYPLQGVSAQGPDGTAPVRLTSGSLTGLTGRTVALPERKAAKLGIGVGDEIAMTLGDGRQEKLRVVATFATRKGYEKLVLPADVVAAHTAAGVPEQILVRADAGTAPAELTAALAALAKDRPGLAVADRDAMIAANAEGEQTQAWVNYLLVGMIIAYTSVSVINTLAASTVRRRREFGLQRLTGATRGQVMRMSFAEGGLVAAAGISLGTLVALATLIPFSAAVAGSAWPSGPLWIFAAIAGVAVLLSLGATTVPAWFSMRTRAAEAAVAAD